MTERAATLAPAPTFPASAHHLHHPTTAINSSDACRTTSPPPILVPYPMPPPPLPLRSTKLQLRTLQKPPHESAGPYQMTHDAISAPRPSSPPLRLFHCSGGHFKRRNPKSALFTSNKIAIDSVSTMNPKPPAVVPTRSPFVRQQRIVSLPPPPHSFERNRSQRPRPRQTPPSPFLPWTFEGDCISHEHVTPARSSAPPSAIAGTSHLPVGSDAAISPPWLA